MFTNKDQEPGPVECRICHSKTTRDLILSPCLCKGSMAYVHFRCLERWLNYSSRDNCELCSFKFNVILNRRYSCLQSVRVWMRHPTNRAFILCDLFIGLILTSLTLTLILVCFLGLSHFVKEGYNQGIQGIWSEGVIDFFLLVLLAGYLATMYSMVRDHIRPWYMWWTRCNNVRLVLDKNVIVSPLIQESSETIAYNNKSIKNQTDELCLDNNLVVQIEKEVEVSNMEHDCSNNKDIKRIDCDSMTTDKKPDGDVSDFGTGEVVKINSLLETAL